MAQLKKSFVFIATYPDNSEKEIVAYTPDDARTIAMMEKPNHGYVKIRRKREES